MKTNLAVFRAGAMTAILSLSCWLTEAHSAVGAEDLVTCSPNHTHVAGVAADGRICYQRSTDGVVEHTFYICHAQALAFSEDGKLLAAAGGRNGSQGKIKIWRLSDHKQLCEIVLGGEGINALAVSSDEMFIAAADKNGTIEAWRVADGQRQWSRNLSPAIDAIYFAADATHLVIQCVNGTQRLLDSVKGRNALQTATLTKE